MLSLGACHLSPLMTPWPGRNESPRRGEDELELVLPELCWLFGLRRLLPPSPSLLTFPAKDGVERALLHEAVYMFLKSGDIMEGAC